VSVLRVGPGCRGGALTVCRVWRSGPVFCLLSSVSASWQGGAVAAEGEHGQDDQGLGRRVGLGRSAGITPGLFPQAALRTRRAALTATGSPRTLPSGVADAATRR
jgi:hypothetical protein